jgi:hypothetical protein
MGCQSSWSSAWTAQASKFLGESGDAAMKQKKPVKVFAAEPVYLTTMADMAGLRPPYKEQFEALLPPTITHFARQAGEDEAIVREARMSLLGVRVKRSNRLEDL